MTTFSQLCATLALAFATVCMGVQTYLHWKSEQPVNYEAQNEVGEGAVEKPIENPFTSTVDGRGYEPLDASGYAELKIIGTQWTGTTKLSWEGLPKRKNRPAKRKA